MQPSGKRPISDLKSQNTAPSTVAKPQEDATLNAVRAADPTEAPTTQDAYDKTNGWKPLDINGTPSEYQIRPAKGDAACAVVTVREKAAPKRILASQHTCG
jgi:hypothetical protein